MLGGIMRRTGRRALGCGARKPPIWRAANLTTGGVGCNKKVAEGPKVRGSGGPRVRWSEGAMVRGFEDPRVRRSEHRCAERVDGQGFRTSWRSCYATLPNGSVASAKLTFVNWYN